MKQEFAHISIFNFSLSSVNERLEFFVSFVGTVGYEGAIAIPHIPSPFPLCL